MEKCPCNGNPSTFPFDGEASHLSYNAEPICLVGIQMVLHYFKLRILVPVHLVRRQNSAYRHSFNQATLVTPVTVSEPLKEGISKPSRHEWNTAQKLVDSKTDKTKNFVKK